MSVNDINISYPLKKEQEHLKNDVTMLARSVHKHVAM